MIRVGKEGRHYCDGRGCGYPLSWQDCDPEDGDHGTWTCLDCGASMCAARPSLAGSPTSAQPTGEEFLEFKEALSDLRSLRAEYDCLNGGGPGWSARNQAAWARVDELFADEDEAAYHRQQEDAHG